ncbi:MAG TPA: hypothetical protein VFD82_07405 [Planctomycetota bacterium]|nr:hypothetical protein [Planctomycetota bacterium]
MPEAFLERDFKAYERHRQDDPEYNALRLSVRRKLKAMVDGVVVEAKALGVELSAQAGLHHPYTMNSYRVREQRAYLCRGAKERKKLAAFFGEALGKDAETHYIQTVLEACLDDQIVEAALRIHPQAWWDGEHLKKKVLQDPARMDELCTLLRALPPGFNLKLHDWKLDHWCSQVKAAAIKEMLQHYTPGNHWLHVQRQLPKEDALVMGPDGEAWVRSSLLALLPIYRFTLWEPA